MSSFFFFVSFYDTLFCTVPSYDRYRAGCMHASIGLEWEWWRREGGKAVVGGSRNSSRYDTHFTTTITTLITLQPIDL